MGKVFDDRGITMSPIYSRKGGLRYRYYVSRAAIQGRKSEAGMIHRVPAHEVETKVIEALRSVLTFPDLAVEDFAALGKMKRVVIERGKITIGLVEDAALAHGSSTISIPWAPRPAKAKREILLPHADPSKDQRPIQVEQRERLLKAVVLGRAWFKDISTGQATDPEAIAVRAGRSNRSVRMMLSLTFVAPDIIEAAVAGALPRGIGLTRLMDLPLLWSEQRQALGLEA
jgi:site-specific DNA recombinase